MYEQVEKSKVNKNRAAASTVAQKSRSVKQSIGFVDNRPNMQKLIVQRTKNAEEMLGIEGFSYDDIINWDGSPGIRNGVEFIVNNDIETMMATLNPNRVHYNFNNVGQMSPHARYFMIMHELSHIYYQHPGNDHPESMLNELQADDTALVNAITQFPTKAKTSFEAISDFLSWWLDQGNLGGGSHPLTVDRRNRIEALYVAIADNATVEVNLDSHFIPEAQMLQFLHEHGNVLLIDADDITTFSAQNGNFSYVRGQGIVTLRRFLDWLPEFEFRKHLIPGFEFNVVWVVRPVTIQNQCKENLPGAIH